jgi:aromatic-L-amino-acid decarboxylase
MNQKLDDFRRAGHEAVDWIADYLQDPRQYPVLPPMKPGDLVDQIPDHAPEKGEPFENLLADFHRLVIPAFTHWNHPRFMAFFSTSASAPGVLAEMLSATINGNVMLWKSSPAGTELEIAAMNWLRQWLGLPEQYFGIIYDTASMSTFTAIAAARHFADPEIREKGASAANLILYTSEQAHSSVEKGALALGIGKCNVRKIGTDPEFRMRADLLKAAIEEDVRAGKRPFCVVATVGTTSTTSVDPVPAIADLAERYKLWLHVDAAYGGCASVLPEKRAALDGIERCDSLVTNPHKWLMTPSDLSAFFTRRPEVLREAFSLVPEYLRTEENPRAVNFMDYGVQLGRRFRALKLWFIMRYYGREGVAEMLRAQIGWTQELVSAIDADPHFERMAPAPFTVVCFRFKGSDDDNHRLIEAVNATGKAFLAGTVLNGHFTVRLAIGNMGMTRDDVMAVWELVKQSAATLGLV